MDQKILNDPELSQQQKDSMLVLYALGKGNPGAYTVVAKMYEIIEQDNTKNEEVMEFIRNLLINEIVGSRLWYIFKNEANTDANKLIKLNLTQFDDQYFDDKYEKST